MTDTDPRTLISAIAAKDACIKEPMTAYVAANAERDIARHAAAIAREDARVAGAERDYWKRRALRDARELAATFDALGSNRFMDPPDGGDVSLSEQIARQSRARYPRLRRIRDRPEGDYAGHARCCAE